LKNNKIIFLLGFMRFSFILSFIFIFLASLTFLNAERLYAQEFNLSFSIFSMYRTCEMIEITGNEDQFDVILKLSANFINYLSSNWLFKSIIDIDFRLPYSDKARFYEFFAPNLIEPNIINFTFSNYNIYFIFEYNQNIALNYHFENFYPSVIQKLPSYPLDSSYYGNSNSSYDYTKYLPYPAFILGPRQLPIYYVNAIYLHDCQFYFKWNIAYFYFIIGVSNGEEGLDSNSSKSFISKFGFQNQNLSFSLSVNLGERGSVPIKIHSQFFTFYFEYSDRNFNFAIEGVFNIHGIRDPRLNPYAENDTIDIEIFNYGPGLFIPDDLPNLIDEVGTNGKMPPLLAAGGFIYLSYKFNLSNVDFLKIFCHYSLYDPNIMNETYLIYKLKHRIVFGMIYNNSFFSILVGANFNYDLVYLNIPQFYEAENRIFHRIQNYDLIFCIYINI